MANLVREIKNLVSEYEDNKVIKALNSVLADIVENNREAEEEEEPRTVRVEKVGGKSAKRVATLEETLEEDDVYEAPKFSEVKEAIIEALDCKASEAREFYETACENSFDWDLKPRALKRAIIEAQEEYAGDEEQDEEAEDEYTAPKFLEVREAIKEALECSGPKAKDFYNAACEDQFDWDLKPRALTKAIRGAQEEYAPEEVEDEEEEVHARKRKPRVEKAVKGDVSLADMTKTELREQVTKLQVAPKDVNMDLAKFLKRVYKLADENKIGQLEKMANTKNVDLNFGRGRQTEIGKKRKMAAQIVAYG